MSNLLDDLPKEVFYIREYALKYGRDTKQETFDLIHKIATKEELDDLTKIDSMILENDHLDVLLEFVKDNLQDFPEEAKKLNSFVWAIMAVPGI
jgi:predicted nucleotidyltransferase